MRTRSPEEVCESTVAGLGLDPQRFTVDSPEALAAAVRRVVALGGALTRRSVSRSIERALGRLVNDEKDLRDLVRRQIDDLVEHGDLIEVDEFDEETGTSRRSLHSTPPSFVRRRSGSVLLLGLADDEPLPLPDHYLERVDHRGVVRSIFEQDGEDIAAYLEEIGLMELSYDGWMRAPPELSPQRYIDTLDRGLELAPPAGGISDVQIVDPEKPVRFYRGRWVEPKRRSGRFVGRRPQAYGADLWVYIELRDGRPTRFLDFPLDASTERGCDQAWRAQAAIDYLRGSPQQYRVRLGQGGRQAEIDFFSPVPQWARRRWNCLGEPIISPGSLFAYSFRATEVEEELSFATDRLWIAKMDAD